MAAPIRTRAPARTAKTSSGASPARAPAQSAPAPTIGEHASLRVIPRSPASIPVHASVGNGSGSRPNQPSPPLLPVQRKLAIGSSSDPLEAEADAAASAALGSQREATVRCLRPAHVTLAEAPPLVHQVLRTPGGELDHETRSWAETSFHRDFRSVRIHTGEPAEASAADMHARAYTVGPRIVLGPGAAAAGPGSRALIVHELAHVVQQGAAPALPQRNRGQAPLAPVLGSTPPMVQRQEAAAEDTGSQSLGWITEAIVTAASVPARALGETAYDLAHATWHGFFAEMKQHGGEAATKVLGRVREFVTSPRELLLFFPKYWWGLIKGVFSPITGLFDLGKLAVQLAGIGGHLAVTGWENREKIAVDASGLGDSMRQLGGKAIDALKGLFLHPVDTVTALVPLLEQAKSEANGAAEQGGHKIAGMLLAAADQPIPDLAETAGEVIGTVVVNVALFVFTSGIGDAIAQIAGRLGEVGAWLGRFGKTAEMLGALVVKLGELLTTVGGWVTKGEALIGKLAGALLKPLEPVLEQFGELMSQLRTFLRDLLGVAEKAESQEVAAAAKGLGAAKKEPHAPRLTNAEPPPPPRQAPEPRTPHPTEPRAPKPALEPQSPELPAPQPEPKPAPTQPAPKPAAPQPEAEPAPVQPGPAPAPQAEPTPEPTPPTAEKPAEPSSSPEQSAKEPAQPDKPRKTRSRKEPQTKEAKPKSPRKKKPPLDSEKQVQAAQRLRGEKAAQASSVHQYHSSAEEILDLNKKLPGLVEDARAVPAPPSLLEQQKELQGISDFEEKLDRLQEIRASKTDWSEAERRYLDTRERLWQARAALQAAEEDLARARAGRVDADIKVPEAEKELGRASQRISDIMRRNGPNFKSVSNVNFDEILGKDAWQALPGAPALDTDHIVPVREIEDMINQSELPRLHSEASPALKDEFEQEFQKLGDIRSNLTRMRKDANQFLKSDRSWADISYQQAAPYGYTSEMVDQMRQIEKVQRQLIGDEINKLVDNFAGRIRPK